VPIQEPYRHPQFRPVPRSSGRLGPNH